MLFACLRLVFAALPLQRCLCPVLPHCHRRPRRSRRVAQIKPRQDKLRDMGGALKAITDETKKGRIDWDNAVIPNAQTIKHRSGYILNWFPKGSGPETDVKTYALPAVWQKPDEFTKLGKQLQADAVKLDQIANAKDEAGLRPRS